eukprot:741097-Rhodomonas_salina.3
MLSRSGRAFAGLKGHRARVVEARPLHHVIAIVIPDLDAIMQTPGPSKLAVDLAHRTMEPDSELEERQALPVVPSADTCQCYSHGPGLGGHTECDRDTPSHVTVSLARFTVGGVTPQVRYCQADTGTGGVTDRRRYSGSLASLSESHRSRVVSKKFKSRRRVTVCCCAACRLYWHVTCACWYQIASSTQDAVLRCASQYLSPYQEHRRGP